MMLGWPALRMVIVIFWSTSVNKSQGGCMWMNLPKAKITTIANS
jgi:hypothetical protein